MVRSVVAEYYIDFKIFSLVEVCSSYLLKIVYKIFTFKIYSLSRKYSSILTENLPMKPHLKRLSLSSKITLRPFLGHPYCFRFLSERENSSIKIPYSTLSSPPKRPSLCQTRRGLDKGDIYFINIYIKKLEKNLESIKFI